MVLMAAPIAIRFRGILEVRGFLKSQGAKYSALCGGIRIELQSYLNPSSVISCLLRGQLCIKFPFYHMPVYPSCSVGGSSGRGTIDILLLSRVSGNDFNVDTILCKETSYEVEQTYS